MNLIYSRSPRSDAFEQSNCQRYEYDFTNYLVDLIRSLGYEPQKIFPGNDPRNERIFSNGSRKVFLCLVDDLIYLDPERGDPLSWMVSPQDVIITDNYFLRPTVARVLKLPTSWFGIYLHRSKETVTEPTKDFTLQINRLDPDRLHLILEMRRQGALLDQGHANINCGSDVLGATQTTEQMRDHCWRCWDRILPHIRQKYATEIESIVEDMPYDNHRMEFETALHSGMLHVCVETYPTTTWSLSLSEKTFRALLAPRPFMLCSGTHTIEYLQSMGFDVMPDLVEHHKYDIKTAHNSELKMSVFVNVIKETIHNLKTRPWAEVRERALAAADHNYHLLSRLRRQWPAESGEFVTTLSRVLSG